MVRLASGALLILALAGCATTQQEAARLRLNSARLRATQVRLRVVQPNPAIKVQSVSLLASHGGSAIVVRLRNLLGHPVSDLPPIPRTIAHPRPNPAQLRHPSTRGPPCALSRRSGGQCVHPDPRGGRLHEICIPPPQFFTAP